MNKYIFWRCFFYTYTFTILKKYFLLLEYEVYEMLKTRKQYTVESVKKTPEQRKKRRQENERKWGNTIWKQEAEQWAMRKKVEKTIREVRKKIWHEKPWGTVRLKLLKTEYRLSKKDTCKKQRKWKVRSSSVCAQLQKCLHVFLTAHNNLNLGSLLEPFNCAELEKCVKIYAYQILISGHKKSIRRKSQPLLIYGRNERAAQNLLLLVKETNVSSR